LKVDRLTIMASILRTNQTELPYIPYPCKMIVSTNLECLAIEYPNPPSFQ